MLHVSLKDSFKKKIEHIQKRSRRSKIHVAKGFYTKENMKKKLGWPASTSKLIYQSYSGKFHLIITNCSVLSQEKDSSCSGLLLPPLQGQNIHQAWDGFQNMS